MTGMGRLTCWAMRRRMVGSSWGIVAEEVGWDWIEVGLNGLIGSITERGPDNMIDEMAEEEKGDLIV